MPDQMTGADSIRQKLTGASSHDGAQADPALSLGNHLSSTEYASMSIAVTNPITNITVLFASEGNGEGAGTLVATNDNDVKWTPPGGTQGIVTTIANGETKIVVAGNSEESKYLRITRTTGDALSGSATVTLAYRKNALFDDVTSAERTAGDTEYRCLAIENVSANTVTDIKLRHQQLGTQQVSDVAQLGASGAGTIETSGSFADWPESGYAMVIDAAGGQYEIAYYASRTATVLTVPAAGRGLGTWGSKTGVATDKIFSVPGAALAKDAPTSQPSGTFEDETGTGENTSPGFTFEWFVDGAIGISGDYLDIGNLAAGEIYGFWFERIVPAGATAVAGVNNAWQLEFDAA